MSEPLWKPDALCIQSANLTVFRQQAEQKWKVELPDYSALYQWSITHRADFWQTVWEFCGVRAHQPWQQVLQHGDKMPGAKWFAGATLNFAENLLRKQDDQPAIIFWNEAGRQSSLTFAQLHQTVANLAASLRRLGLKPGDRVAGFMPNMPETIIAMLATASLGGVWSSCSPDFGLDGVLDRFGQIEPRFLFTPNSYLYNGKSHQCLPRMAEVGRQLPSLAHTIVVPYLDAPATLDGLHNPLLWNDVIAEQSEPLTFERLPFDHPLYVLYSSGTTGKPKCIVHGAGGTLLQHLKEHQLHTNLKSGDRLFYFTTCGWMMWNWLATGLASDATLLLYDGSPMAREGNILFDMAQQEQMNVLGTSAKYLASIEKMGLEPRQSHNLSSVRTILSTGSPLLPEGFDYVYQKVKPDVCLSSISGGTDIVSCFALGNPTAPVYRGEIQTRGLGMKVEVFNDEGQAVQGEKGELVCTAPFPSMPIGFWNDPQGTAYHAAYFDVYENVWRHGDFAELTEHEGLIIFGRSDATLNPGGVRIGTAEIYRPVEQLPEILESLVIGQDWQGDVRLVLFVKLRDDIELTDALRQTIKDHIRRHATPRHVPAKILSVPDLPRTKSGKIVELAVRDILHNRPLKNLSALANPHSLDHFRNRPELAE